MLGELVGTNDSIGVTGIVPDASVGLVNAFNVEDGYDLADAIDLATANAVAGDVMLIEQQAPGANGGCGPSQVGCVAVEWVQAYYDAIVNATAAGIIVVEAAGNGSEDLETSATTATRSRPVERTRARSSSAPAQLPAARTLPEDGSGSRRSGRA